MKYEFHPNYHLFLDDERDPSQVTWVEIPQLVHWVVVRSYGDFIRHISHEARKGVLPGFISFDHDLADEHYQAYLRTRAGATHEEAFKQCKEKTGYDCAKWLVETYLLPNNLTVPNYQVHSMNPEGAANIRSYLESYKRSIQPKC